MRRARGGEVALRDKGKFSVLSRRAFPQRQFKVRISANPVVQVEKLFERQTSGELEEFIRRCFKKGEAVESGS